MSGHEYTTIKVRYVPFKQSQKSYSGSLTRGLFSCAGWHPVRAGSTSHTEYRARFLFWVQAKLVNNGALLHFNKSFRKWSWFYGVAKRYRNIWAFDERCLSLRSRTDKTGSKRVWPSKLNISVWISCLRGMIVDYKTWFLLSSLLLSCAEPFYYLRLGCWDKYSNVYLFWRTVVVFVSQVTLSQHIIWFNLDVPVHGCSFQTAWR